MKAASESLRYSYDLDAQSVVLNVGAYHGNFAAEFAKRYDCRVCAFEPVSHFYRIAQQTLAPFPKVELYNFGLGATSRVETFGVQNDSSGMFATSAEVKEHVSIRGIRETLILLGLDWVDLLELNCEGAECEILAEIIRLGWTSRFREIQVQVHFNRPQAEEEWQTVHEALSETHIRTWGGDWQYWTNYKLFRQRA